MIEFGLLTVSVGGLWLAYNQANYGNPLEWANGPYSARAIQERHVRQRIPVIREKILCARQRSIF